MGNQGEAASCMTEQCNAQQTEQCNAQQTEHGAHSVSRGSGADRVRQSRARRKRLERVVPFEIRDSEVAGLVSQGYLEPARQNDPRAIGDALGRLFDQFPPSQWPAADHPGL
jgi:hypothetical protein